MAKLLPCPFCGGNPSINKRQAGPGFFLVQCNNADCAVIVETREIDRGGAIQNWNTRFTADVSAAGELK